jgi:hypothetical protein
MNFKLALRRLVKTPFVSLVSIVSLALGIGANAAIFSLYDQTLLRPLPVGRPGELVSLTAPGPKPGSTSCNQAGGCDEVFSYAMFRDLERLQTVFTGLAAHVSFGANLAYHGQTMNAQGMLVSGSYFPVLGLQPALGRLLTPDDDRNIGNHFVTVLSHDYWATRLGANPAVLNETITDNGQALTVVGVAPGAGVVVGSSSLPQAAPTRARARPAPASRKVNVFNESSVKLGVGTKTDVEIRAFWDQGWAT